MNAQFPVEVMLEATRAEAPLRPRPAQGWSREKFVSGAVAVALHGALLAALLTVAPKIVEAVHPTTVTVEVVAQQASKQEAVPVRPEFVKAELPVVPVPEVQIATAAPVSIQVTAETPPPAAAPAPSMSKADYYALILARLNRFKRYPAEARRAHIQGVVMLHFVMNAQGVVQSFEISKKSGFSQLDEEALALIQRAQPLPPIPADFGRSSLDLVVPIEFSLS